MTCTNIWAERITHFDMQNSEYLEVTRIWYEVSRYYQKIYFSQLKKLPIYWEKLMKMWSNVIFANIKWTVEENILKNQYDYIKSLQVNTS